MSAGIDKTVPLKVEGASIVTDWLAVTSFVSTILMLVIGQEGFVSTKLGRVKAV